MISLIARRELKEWFSTPAGWLLLAVVQLLTSWLLFAQLEVYLKIQPQLTAASSPLGIYDLIISPMLSATAIALLIFIPLLGMRGFSAEISSGRMALLLSSPLSLWQWVWGKWLGLMLACLPALAPVLMLSVWLGLGSALDAGRLAASLLGLLWLTALASAISLWLSALNSQALGAATASWGLLWLLWLIDASGSNSLQTLSLKAHLLPFFKGWVRTQDVAYFGAITLAVWGLTVHRLWRLGGGR